MNSDEAEEGDDLDLPPDERTSLWVVRSSRSGGFVWEFSNYNGRDDMKVLVVFPQATAAILERRAKLGLPPIPIKELEYGMGEVTQIVNLLGAKLLADKQATIHGLLDILAQGWDIVWLITHADQDGWYLTDGIVNASETTTLVRSSGTFLLVMNTCSSYEVAWKVSQELGIALICTVKEVPDRQAFITGVIFAQQLAAGQDYVQAYENAKPGQNSTYELFQARGRSMLQGDRNRSQSEQSHKFDSETWRKFTESVKELDTIVNGNQRIGVIGLKNIIEDLQRRLDNISRELHEIRDRQRVRNWLMWGMGATILALLVTVALLVSRVGG